MPAINKTTAYWAKTIAPIVVIWLILQLIACLGQALSGWYSTHRALDSIERRISLDQAFIDLGNATLGTPVNQQAVSRYLAQFNATLAELNYPVRLLSLQGVSGESAPAPLNKVHKLVLTTPEQQVIAEVYRPLPIQFLSFSVPAMLLTLVALPLRIHASRRTRQRARIKAHSELPAVPKLLINLENKTLGNGVDDTQVILQNKPLCFYTALVKYCIDNPGAPLQHHKQVPEELLSLANRVFTRLIELGHTKRKRPDFNANLDKTLSEIRAALDEVFFAYNEHKEVFYPPRAQGEGSRSKQHSYALPAIQDEEVEIIGN